MPLIDLVEAAYDLRAPASEWLGNVARAVDEVGGGGGRTVVLEFAVEGLATSWIRRIGSPGLSADERAFLERGFRQPALMATMRRYLGPPDAMPPFSRLSETLGRFGALRPVFEPFARFFGFDDLVAVAANDGSGAGLIANLLVRPGTSSGLGWPRLRLALPHLNAALRLRRALPEPEVILDESGQVRHGEVAAEHRERLRATVLARDKARTRAGRHDPEALLAWTALVEGRWSLVDSFEAGGRRYVLAMPNLPEVRDPRGLSPAERAVLALLLLGHSNKEIAFDLGLAQGTVGAYMASIRRKLGDDVLRAAPHGHRASLSQVSVGAVELAMLVVDQEEARTVLASRLSPAERDVVRLALGGLANAEIAAVRGVSERTVANQLAGAYRRLQVRSRRELRARLGSETPG
jgi:DNA-binding CsgD family transcriptional regulator